MSNSPSIHRYTLHNLQFNLLRIRLSVVLFVAGILAMPGCHYGPQANYADVELLQIAGTITLDGIPLNNVEVRFVDEDKTFSSGITDDLGRYKLMFDSNTSGVRPGLKTVTLLPVTISDSEDPGDKIPHAEEETSPGAESTRESEELKRIPRCFRVSSIISVSLDQSNSYLDFALQSDCSKTW